MSSTTAKVVKHSGFQKEVLKLYRLFMKEARKRPEPQRSQLQSVIRQRFKENKDYPRQYFDTIEYLLELGYRRLRQLQEGQVDAASFIHIPRKPE